MFSCCPQLEILIYFQEPRRSEGLCPHFGLFATSVESYLTSRNHGSRMLTPSIHAYNISPDILRCITDYPQFSSRLQLLHVHYESWRRHALELSIQTQATVGMHLKDLFLTCQIDHHTELYSVHDIVKHIRSEHLQTIFLAGVSNTCVQDFSTISRETRIFAAKLHTLQKDPGVLGDVEGCLQELGRTNLSSH